MAFQEALVISLVKILMLIFSLLTLPVYALVQAPWRQLRHRRGLYGVSRSGSPAGPYERVWHESRNDHLVEGIKTLDQLFRVAVKRGGQRALIGSRVITGRRTQHQPDGSSITKIEQGPYRWQSCVEVERRVDMLARSMRSIGLGSSGATRICILTETREEWLLTALAAFRENITVVTLYANLGDEGIVYGLNHSKAEVIVASTVVLDILLRNLSKLVNLKTVIYFDDSPTLSNMKDLVENDLIKQANYVFSAMCMRYYSAEDIAIERGPTADDVAIVMYTSGSTGVPKGVELTHGNMIHVIKGFLTVVSEDLIRDGAYLAYLPLAHIFELQMEMIAISLCVRIGYSSPLTVTDASPGVVDGQRGDVSLVSPTLMALVPLVLDRLRKGVLQNAASKGPIFSSLFHYCLEYKTFWMRWGFGTPLLDRLVFRKTRALLGGRLRVLIVGSAQMSPDSHRFARAALCRDTLYGFGLTETAAAVCVQQPGATSESTCGAPMKGTLVRLEAWPEGGYHPEDRAQPRGEILAGGDGVAKGYFSSPELTEEAMVMIDGVRYIRTGDIGEITAQGELRVIDRKKDLFKGPSGEYVAFGRIEAELKTCPLVENVCVHGDTLTGRLVAIIVVNQLELLRIADRVGKRRTLIELCADAEVRSEVRALMRQHAMIKGLLRRETPSWVVLVPEPWTPQSGLVTAAMKVRRLALVNHYRREIDAVFDAFRHSQR